MDNTNQNPKNRFDSLSKEAQLTIINRYVDKYKAGSREQLIDWALKLGLAGELTTNPNYAF